ncbi:hypothetical protein XENORESO_019687 [Xenotaenia resolanae]|uniref:CUB domain-containing protein n=1 Tax=Xenotaenia resolanae TaxID=208358 RepID=A0ABV0WBM8_9TELE
MTKSQGEIKTPNWPDRKYPPGTSCSWLITVEPDRVGGTLIYSVQLLFLLSHSQILWLYVIQVMFDKFVLEADTYCRFDYVAFFNGGQRDDSRLIGKYCGDQSPQPIISSGNELLVQFVSDLSVTSDGFFGHYKSIPRGSQPMTVNSGPSTGSGPSERAVKPAESERPAVTIQPPVSTTASPKYVTPSVRPTRRVVTNRNPKRLVPQNPLCARACKRAGTIKKSFCSSEFGMFSASVI